MKKEIRIPDIAENVETGVIANVLVSEGDEISSRSAGCWKLKQIRPRQISLHHLLVR